MFLFGFDSQSHIVIHYVKGQHGRQQQEVLAKQQH
jgi:hypothetical protein